MEEIINILKWTVLVNGIALVLVMIHSVINSKRIKHLEKSVAELTVLVLANPHTDEKLVEHFMSGKSKPKVSKPQPDTPYSVMSTKGTFK